MRISPGTSPNQARYSKLTAGNASTSSAPQSSIAPRTDQIHLTGLASALRTCMLLLSAVVATQRDTEASVVVVGEDPQEEQEHVQRVEEDRRGDQRRGVKVARAPQ